MTLNNKMPPEQSIPPIRSFVKRAGRMTLAQQRGIQSGWEHHGLALLPQKNLYCWEMVFERQAPVHLEIGFGNGESLIALAKAFPELNFVGIEVHQPGVGRCLHLAAELGLKNIKVFSEDALKVLECIPSSSLDRVLLLFPDPWPKKKHHKRRIVQPHFVSLLAQKIKSGGLFQLATDWQPYADHMLTVLESAEDYKNAFGKNTFAPEAFERIQTKFERRGQKLGHAIFDLVFTRR